MAMLVQKNTPRLTMGNNYADNKTDDDAVEEDTHAHTNKYSDTDYYDND